MDTETQKQLNDLDGRLQVVAQCTSTHQALLTQHHAAIQRLQDLVKELSHENAHV